MSTSEPKINALRAAIYPVRRENHPQTIIKTPASSYRPILLIHDCAVFLPAFLGTLYISSRYLAGAYWPNFGATALMLTLATIVFFRAFRMYDYHFIFEKRLHLIGLLKAFTLGLCTLVTVVFILVMLSVIGSRAWKRSKRSKRIRISHRPTQTDTDEKILPADDAFGS